MGVGRVGNAVLRVLLTAALLATAKGSMDDVIDSVAAFVAPMECPFGE